MKLFFILFERHYLLALFISFFACLRKTGLCKCSSYYPILSRTIAKVLNCDIVLSVFEPQLNSTTTVFLQRGLWHLITHKGWHVINHWNQTRPSSVRYFACFVNKKKKNHLESKIWGYGGHLRDWVAQLHSITKEFVSLEWHYIASGGEASVLGLWRMWSTPLLPLLQGPLWPGVIVPVRVLSIGKTDLFKNDLYCMREIIYYYVNKLLFNRIIKNSCNLYEN